MLNIHHIGCLVEDIETVKSTYRDLMNFKNISEICFVQSQNIKVCFIEIGKNVFIELIQPLAENSLYRLLKKGTTYYHIAYLADNFENTIDDLISKDYLLINTFHSEAFNNKRCAFLSTPERHLIELIEDDSG